MKQACLIGKVMHSGKKLEMIYLIMKNYKCSKIVGDPFISEPTLKCSWNLESPNHLFPPPMQQKACCSKVRARRPVTSLSHQEGRRVFREGAEIFLNYVQYFKIMSNTFFPGRAKNVLGRASPPRAPLGYGPACSCNRMFSLSRDFRQHLYNHRMVLVSWSKFHWKKTPNSWGCLNSTYGKSSN